MTATLTPSRLDGLDHDGMAQLYGGLISISAEAAVSLGSMEGMVEAPVRAEPAAAKAPALGGKVGGYALAAALAAAAYGMHYLPFAPFAMPTSAGGIRRPIGAAMLSIVFGVIVANLIKLPKPVVVGAKEIVKSVIPYAIVCIGAGLNLVAIGNAGVVPLVIMLGAVATAYGSAYLAGRVLGLSHKTAALLGVGTGICGSSAIVAAAPLIDAEDDDLVLSVGTVNLLGLVMMLLLPVFAPLLSMTSEQFGVWCGASIHAVPQVLAAGDAYFKGGDAAADSVQWATLVKLGRVALLAPVVFILALVHSKKKAAQGAAGGVTVKYHQLVPWFIWGFVIMAALGTMDLIPKVTFGDGDPIAVGDFLEFAGKLLLTFAMAAIGLGVNLRLLVGVGGRAVVAGAVSSIILALAALGLVYGLM
jgi:uncharacterized integral membrane protein (TIGR00698 family)